MSSASARVLVVDDNREMATTIADSLVDRGYDAVAAVGGRDAIARLEGEPFDAVVTDLRMPSIDGLAVLGASRRLDPDRPVIVMTAFSAIDTAIESIRQGAYHYLTKPFKTEELGIFLKRALDENRLRREATSLRTTLKQRFSAANIIGGSAAMRAVIAVIERVADANVPVLISGDTGSGKGVVARALHAESVRRAGTFVPLNCAALPESLLETELFGHVRGAFSGATSDRAGLFVEADGGTLFLDEIGEMPLGLQAKLLRALETSAVRPVGSNREKSIDVRIVAATNRDLREAVAAGSFREDLLYRLDVVSISVPALQHRREDIPSLLGHFLGVARERHPQSPVRTFDSDALDALATYAWPGNVRELAHTVERVVLLASGPEVHRSDLPDAIGKGAGRADVAFRGNVIPIRDVQRQYAAWALAQFGGHRGRTAHHLGVDGKTLAKWLSDKRGEPSDAQDDDSTA
ncbi:MAG TPA: sigma-54 dependent transcriptional regulator [Polyangia bacterium]|nr:sigma-54 dependent transcriptional regulator [Polyangia bacterium]